MNLIDLDAAPDFVLAGDGRLIDNRNGIDLQSSLREALVIITGILADAVDLNLPEPDMTTDQKQEAAAALFECADILRAYAGDFAEIASSERADFINTITTQTH